MKNRFLSFLLALLLLISICPVYAAEQPELTGEEVGIFSAVENKIMTTEENSYTNQSGYTKLELKSAKATVQDGRIVTDAENAARFTLAEKDGTVTFVTSDGKYLYADGTDVKLADTESAYTKFVLEETADGTMIRCNSATFNGKPQYLEYFSGYFSVFTKNTDTANFIFGLYPFDSNEACKHIWEKTGETAATCTLAGSISYTCTICGTTNNDTVPAMGHSFENGICTVCGAEKPSAGEEVGIFSSVENKVMTTEETSYTNQSGYTKLELKSAKATVQDGRIVTDAENAARFTLAEKDGTVTFVTSDGKYLYADGTDVKLADTESAYTKFVLEETADGTMIRCNSATFNGKPQYLEYFSGYFSVFTKNTNTANFTFGLYPFDSKEDCQHNWEKTGEVAATCTLTGSISYTCTICGATNNETVPATGHSFENGICTVCGAEQAASSDEIVIFYPAESKVITTESYFYNNSKYELKAADATLVEGEVETAASNVARFTVIDNGDTVTFATDDGLYLYADGTHVKLVETEGEYTKFVIEETTGGVYIRCATAAFNGKPQYLEYWYENISVYSLNTGNAAIYTFALYPLKEAEKPCEHTNTELHGTIDATCTEEGYTGDMYCLDCGAMIESGNAIPALGHDMIVDEEALAATCTEPGKTESAHCSRCDYAVTSEEVPALGHDYVSGICSQCGEEDPEYNKDCTHENTEIRDNADPTCEVPGYTGDTYCLDCGAKVSNGETIPATGHSYENGTCTNCGQIDPNYVPPCAHENIELRNEKAATCLEAGYTGDIYCKDCGELLGNGTVIAALGHAYEVLAAVAPTCTEPGFSGGACCSRCGDILLAQQQIPALGHNYVDGSCVRCGEAEPTELIETEPVDTEPVETQPIETEPVETDPIETEPIETEPVDTEPFETEPADPKDPCEGYIDIDRSAWYHSAADFVIARGIMGSTKTDSLTFEPFTVCTRAMIATMLYSMEGKPQASYQSVFPDVGEGQWYTDAVMWAYQCGVVTGYDNGKFGPNDKVTREQMAVILKAYAEKVKSLDTSKTDDLSRFADANKVTWSKPYITWAVAEGLISGKAAGDILNLDPQGNATRAEVAAIIKSFITNILDAE